MKLFAQIQKVDEAKRLVFGRAADETVDKADERLNYAGSKPHFQKWSADIAADTDGKSLGNVRAMHGKVAAGKLTDISFDDDARTIDVCAKVVDDNEWKKVMEGVYTGFSIGGSYGEKSVEKMQIGGAEKSVTSYIAIPSEISLVDRPCIPTAKFFEVQKADGTLAKVDFKEAEAEPAAGADTTPDVEVTGTPDEIIAFGKLMNEKGLSMSQVIDLVKGENPFAAKEDACPEGCDQAAWDKMSADEKKAFKAKGEAEPDADDAEKVAAEGALAKLEAALADPLLKIGARNSSTDKGRIEAIHKAVVELGAECGAANKSEAAEDLNKSDGDAMQKMIAAAVEPLQKALDEAKDKINKLEAQPMPTKVSLRAVSKAADVDDPAKTGEPTEADLVKDSHGEVHPAASLLKQLHQIGGQPMAYRG